MQHSWIGVLSALLLATTAGCSGESWRRVAVAGAVTERGQTPGRLSITFVPAAGVEGPAAGTAVVNGKFTLDTAEGPVAGPHLVRIVKPIDGDTKMARGLRDSESSRSQAKTSWEFKVVIPDKSTFEYNVDLD